MRDLRLCEPRSFSHLRPGRTLFDCSGPIHRDWLHEALFVRGLKVHLHRRTFLSSQMQEIPVHDGLQMSSGDLGVALHRLRGTVGLLVDDIGSLHFHESPLEVLESYYDALATDGRAWIRFPKTFFVFIENGKRIFLQDYLTLKYPTLTKQIRKADLDPILAREVSSGEDWLQLHKERGFPKLNFSLRGRIAGGSARSADGTHSPYLEFVEKKAA